MLAKLFTKDPMNLRVPNVQKAPSKTFVLSGARLTFKCPDQTANIPGVYKGYEFDFERDTDEEIGDPHNRYEVLFRTGWSFEDAWWKAETYGGIRMGIFIANNNQRLSPQESLFHVDNLVTYSLEIERQGFIRSSASIAQVDDSQITEEDIKTKRYSSENYPETADEIELISSNGRRWASFETHFPDRPPKIHFQTAVEHNNLVRFVFSQDAYGGIDFFGPNHNLKAACRRMIEEIMNTVTLELSPKGQAQREAVIARYGKDTTV